MIRSLNYRITVVFLVILAFCAALLMNSHLGSWIHSDKVDFKPSDKATEQKIPTTTAVGTYRPELQETGPPSTGTPTLVVKSKSAEIIQNQSIKWIVTTSPSSEPSEQILKLAKTKGWNLVVVGKQTTASPGVWRSANIVYMGPKEQADLTTSLGRKLEQNVRHIKVYGYLYAIQQGASHIYDVDSHLVIQDVKFQFDPMASGMVYNNRSRSVVNPHVHFGHPSIKARGFPLEFEASPYNDQYKVYSSFKTPVIQQGVSSQYMDVDVSRRMTTGWSGDPSFSVSPKSREPPVTVPPGMLAPFNSKNTLYSAEAFWALLLPNSAPGTMTDIWRSYWSQPLLWITGNTLAFWPTNTSLWEVDVINMSPYDDMKDELEFYRMAKGFVDFLVNWTCEEKSFFKCVQQLTIDLAEKGFCDENEVQVTSWWINSLKALHYEEPKITFKMSPMSYEEYFQDTDFREVFLVHNSSQNTGSTNLPHSYEPLLTLGHVCRDHVNVTNTLSENVQSTYTYPDILLVLVFNFPYIRSIGYLEALYRTHFPNILYCTNDNYELLDKKIRGGWSLPWSQDHIRANVLSAKLSRGVRGYECAIGAIEMNYPVRGYLFLADDMLFNFWNFKDLIPLDIPLTSNPAVTYHNRHISETSTSWGWWMSQYGMSPMNTAIEQLKQIASNTSDSRSQLVSTYYQNLTAQGFNDSLVWFGLADIYYIPALYAPLFATVIKTFAKYRPTMEIAIPTTIKGLVPQQLNVTFRGISLWNTDRDDPLEYFNVYNDYLHPVKLSGILSNRDSNLTSDYCQYYIQQVINHW